MTAVEEFVDSIAVGSARLSAITHGVLFWAPEISVSEQEWRAAMPEADAEGKIPCELNAYLIRIGTSLVLVDPGPDEPGTAWSEHFQHEWPGSVRTPGLSAGLARLGITPDDITHVVISHAHFDHFAAVTHEMGGRQVPRFPNAEVVLQRAEWDGNPERSDPSSDVATRLAPLFDAGRLRLVQGDVELVPGIRLVEAPGESPGHMAVRVESDGAVAWIVGDMAHHRCEIEHPDWMPAERDAAAMRASRGRIYPDAAATGATVAFTHERFPPWGHIVSHGSGYRWMRLTDSNARID